jgi:pyruvate dehydrogenase E2 component (dihydrolipoamide acetyltransferase)
MAEYIVMPKLGFDMREAVLVSWNKDIGDQVEKGEVVAEIESDKATLELESQASGTLLKFLATDGDVVAIGGNLAIVGKEGEDISSMDSGSAEAAPKEAASDDADSDEATPDEAKEKPEPKTAEKEKEAPAAEAEAPSGEAVSEEFPDGVKATPVARRVAQEHNVDLKQVNGSGPGGRIRKADVENFMETRTAAPAVSYSPTAVPTGPETEEVKTTRLRQAIGRRMVESKVTIPHFYVTTDVDMAAVMKLRKQINDLNPPELKVTVNDLIVKGAALALRDFLNINASFGGEKLIRHNRINVGTAVAVEGGLLTVVQKNTDITPLTQVAVDNREMIQRARNGKSRPADFEDGTFTVSNLGAFDVDHFIAIINPPNAAILAVGSAAQVPVVVNGELAIGWRMKATISADHRVTDGAEAAQYMQKFKSIMEEPLRLLMG